MIAFEAGIHTVDALASQTLRLHTEHPEARVVGSLGRSVIFDQLLGDPFHEFTYRGQRSLEVAGKARDIDILGVSQTDVTDYDPFEVEASGFSNPYVRFVNEGDDWFVVSDRHDFAEALRPEVMEPVHGTGLLGLELVTLPAQTLVATYGLKGHLRKKDIRTKALLQEAMSTDDRRGDYPVEFLDPLAELAARNRSSMYVRAQDAYRRHVPNSIRSRAVPLMQTAKKIFLS